jgi:hypothetical protein
MSRTIIFFFLLLFSFPSTVFGKGILELEGTIKAFSSDQQNVQFQFTGKVHLWVRSFHDEYRTEDKKVTWNVVDVPVKIPSVTAAKLPHWFWAAEVGSAKPGPEKERSTAMILQRFEKALADAKLASSSGSTARIGIDNPKFSFNAFGKVELLEGTFFEIALIRPNPSS